MDSITAGLFNVVSQLANGLTAAGDPLAAKICRDWVKEIKLLQTTVAKLPKCWRLDEHGKLVQDVPVVPRMEVWLTGGGEYPGEVECVGEGDAVIVNDSIHWMASPLGEISDGSVRDASTLFSTREAADAAEET